MAQFPTSLTDSFETIGTNVTGGNDAIEFAANFFDKLSKAHRHMAKQLEECTGSRAAKMERMFGGSGTVEPVDQLSTSWNKLLGDLNNSAKAHTQLADALHDVAVTPLNQYVSNEAKKQVANANTGKKAVKELKAAHSKVIAEAKRYHKTCSDLVARKKKLQERNFDQEKLDKDSDMKRYRTNIPKERESYQESIASYKKLHEETFTVALPKLMEEMKQQEQTRIQTLKAACVQAIDAITQFAHALQFTGSLDALKSIDEDASNTFETEFEQPDVPEFEEGEQEDGDGAEADTAAEASKDEATSETKKEESKPAEKKSFFGGLFSSSKKDEGKKDDTQDESKKDDTQDEDGSKETAEKEEESKDAEAEEPEPEEKTEDAGDANNEEDEKDEDDKGVE